MLSFCMRRSCVIRGAWRNLLLSDKRRLEEVDFFLLNKVKQGKGRNEAGKLRHLTQLNLILAYQYLKLSNSCY